MSRNIYELFFSRTKDALTEPFLSVPGGLTYTFGQVDRRSAAIATALSQAGAQPGDRVASQVDKSPDSIALYLGCLRGGFVFVPLDSRLGVEDIGYYLGDCEPAVFVCNESDADRMRPVADIVGVDVVHTLSSMSTGSLADAANEVHPLNAVVPRDPHDVAVIIYTSGTDGRPKGTMLTHGNLISSARALHAIWRWRPGDVLLHTLPISSSFGLFVGLHASLINASEIILAPSFDPAQTTSLMANATVYMERPENLYELLSSPVFSKESTKSLRLLVSSSAYLPYSTFGQFIDRLDVGICECYTITEAGVVASNPPEGERIGGTVGYAIPKMNVRIISPQGTVLGPGEIGEIQVAGPSVFSGYWSQPEATKSAFTSDGYLHTGDVGFIEEDGRLTLTGRVKDLITSEGVSVYPREIEIVLESVVGVKESVAIGLPHPQKGQALCVFVVADARVDSTQLMNALAEHLEPYKMPQEIVFVPDLPKSKMGVIQRTALADKHAELFTAEKL